MLNQIIEVKKEEVKELYAQNYTYSLTTSERGIPHYPFVKSLLNPKRSSALIAEVKKASPSKGLIRENFDPISIAQAYARAGADCLSVLTDQRFFQGDPTYIAKIKEHVALPILRKDFIIDPLQIEQSIELGADAILLIAKALPMPKLVELYHTAEERGLDVLIEIHDQQELEELLKVLKPKLIGINNRNLATFQTSITVTKELKPLIPQDVAVISESGIHSAEMITELEQIGVHGFLIGEYFMRQTDVQRAVENLYVQA